MFFYSKEFLRNNNSFFLTFYTIVLENSILGLTYLGARMSIGFKSSVVSHAKKLDHLERLRNQSNFLICTISNYKKFAKTKI